MTTMTDADMKKLKQHLDIARTEIQKTINDLAKGGISLTAVHIIFLEGALMTQQKMSKAGTSEKGLANCRLIAKGNLVDRGDLK
jgi:hypothetical protein